jgi:hypothetical protein
LQFKFELPEEIQLHKLNLIVKAKTLISMLSAFRTHEDRQPTSEFIAACPCPDGLMQDGTQERNEAYVISHRGARSRGYKRRERARARARERERERERERVPACVRLCLSRLPRLPLCQRVFTYVHLNVCQREPIFTCLRKALDIPFYRYKEMPSCTTGCSYALTWLAGKCLEPCTRANVVVVEVP